MTEQNISIYPSVYTVTSLCANILWSNVNFQPIGVSGKRVWNFSGACKTQTTITDCSRISITYKITTPPFSISLENKISGTLEVIDNTTLSSRVLNAELAMTYSHVTTTTEIIVTLYIMKEIVSKNANLSFQVFIKDSGNTGL